MDARELKELADICLAELAARPPDGRVVIGISGVPGSGKTTLAAAVTALVNQSYLEACPDSNSNSNSPSPSPVPIAIAVPMDGFHYTRAHLRSMPNGREAVARRGAAFTFDADAFVALLRRLAVSPPSETIRAPSFAHATKDPVADSIAIPPQCRLVVVEGNYLALDRHPWREARSVVAQLWHVETPAEVCVQRIATRHLAAGIVGSMEEAVARATASDARNADDIRANLLRVDRVIRGG